MSNVIAPPFPTGDNEIGKTLNGQDGTLELFGYTLPNFLSENINTLLGSVPWYITNQTTLFDVSSLTINHEVVAIISNYTSTSSNESIQVIVEWYRKRDSKLLFSTSFFDTIATLGSTYYSAFWLGYVSKESSLVLDIDEFMENGEYYATLDYYKNGTLEQQSLFDIAIIGIPPLLTVRDIAQSSFNWSIGVTNYFNTDSYIRIGITTIPFVSGASSISGILDYTSAPSTNTGCAGDGSVSGLLQGTTYTLYPFAQATNGLYYIAGDAVEITTEGSASEWAWYSTVASGEIIEISDTEWNDFTSRINLIRGIKGYSSYSFSTVATDDDWYAYIANQARTAINDMSPTIAVPSSVSTGSDIYASFFNGLKDSLNSL